MQSGAYGSIVLYQMRSPYEEPSRKGRLFLCQGSAQDSLGLRHELCNQWCRKHLGGLDVSTLVRVKLPRVKREKYAKAKILMGPIRTSPQPAHQGIIAPPSVSLGRAR